MRIALDISQLAHEKTGVARFTEGLVRAILENDTKNEWVFFYSSLRKNPPAEIVEAIEHAGHILVRKRIPPTALEFLWNRLHLVKIERFIGNVDWVITSDWTEPPAKARKATIVHDLTFKRFPELVASDIQSVMKRRFKHVAKESTHIFCDSEATREDLLHLYPKINAERTTVIYPGVTMPEPDIEAITHTLFVYKLHRPYILCVGKDDPRKNYARLISAFQKRNHQDIDLVLVGPSSIDVSDPNIHALGSVPEKHLAPLYAKAQGLIFPSLYEGFGYPAVEAMLLNCPTALAETSSLKELGTDDTTIFLNPEDEADITRAINILAKLDNPTRSTQIKRAKKFAQTLTWKNYFEKMIATLNSYNR